MEVNELIKITNQLVALSAESELVEFKANFHSKEEIGKRISAMSNSARVANQPYAYLVFGVEDQSHDIIGTTFNARTHKTGNELLELWLVNMLNPKIDFQCYYFEYSPGIYISLYRIPAAGNIPVKFTNIAYIRINSATKPLSAHPEKEAKIWKERSLSSLETKICKQGISVSEVIELLSTEAYFDLMKIPYPRDISGVIEKLLMDNIVVSQNGCYDITELGALLLAKNLKDFNNLSRKGVRVIVYKGKNKVETVREQLGTKGYAVGFEGLVEWINGQLPANEEIGKALRRDVRMYPEIAIRELVANSLIHQNFEELGFPVVEIYSDRIEISNPGLPLINTERFIDEYVSRNPKLADIMRRMGICEEKGSGMDKVIFQNELYQLPAINILIQENRTTVSLYAYKTLNETDKKEKIRACYQHACLKYVSNEKMTNQSIRDRFGITEQNSAIASRIIKDTLSSQLIIEDDPESKSRKFKKYIPFWA